MDFNFSVVTDEAELAEFVHEKADPGPCRADHFGQRFLTDMRIDGRRITFLTKVRQQKEKPREALFTRIEQLVDQVFFDPAVPGQ